MLLCQGLKTPGSTDESSEEGWFSWPSPLRGLAPALLLNLNTRACSAGFSEAGRGCQTSSGVPLRSFPSFPALKRRGEEDAPALVVSSGGPSGWTRRHVHLVARRTWPSPCQLNPVGTKDLFILVLQLSVPTPHPAEGSNKTLIDYRWARIQPTQPSRMRSEEGWRRGK